MAKVTSLTPEKIAGQIHYIRGEKVLLDFDLSSLYGVQTRALKQQVRRNIDRFPEDFMFQLTKKEWKEQVENNQLLGASKYSPSIPFAFTEQGVAMLSSVLRSPKAVEVNIAVMRTFVQLRKMMDSNTKLEKHVENMEKEYNEKFEIIFTAIKNLVMEDLIPEKRKSIGFKTNSRKLKPKKK